LSPDRDALLKRALLGLAGLIDQQPAEQAGPGADPRTKCSIPADRAKYGADAGASGGTGQRALLGRGHVGAADGRQRDSCEQQ
jgi:hypothetical protein